MKVLKITPWYPNEINPLLGSFVEDQATALVKEGIDVGVLFVDMNFKNILKKATTHHFKSIFKNENEIKVFRYYGIFPPRLTLGIYKKWRSYFEILFKKYLEKFGLPNILHAHTFHGAFVASFLSEKYNIPFLVTEHSSILITKGLHGWRRQLLQESFQNAAKIISVSNGLKDVLQSYIANEITVIPNLINVDLFSIKTAQKTKTQIELIAVGDLIPIKGFHLLIKAISQLSPLLKKKIRLTIIGKGKEKNKLKNLIRSLKLEENITLEGELARAIVAKKMKAADIFVLPSLEETFGIVLIEAMSTGLPILSTQCVGPKNIVTKTSGVLISPGNLNELVHGIEKISECYQSYSPLKIRQVVVDNYSEKIVAQKLIYLYNSIVFSNRKLMSN